MDDRYLVHLLSRVAGRYRRARLAWLLTGVWFGLSAALFFLAYLGMLPSFQSWVNNKQAIQWIVIGVCVGLVGSWLLTRLAFRDHRWIALQIEDRYPTLQQRLITLSQPSQPGESLYLRRALIKETIHHGRINDWTKALSSSRMLVAWLFQFAALAFASTVAFAAFSMHDATGLANNLRSVPAVDEPAIRVEPGSVEIERGSDLVITARFAAPIPEVAVVESTDSLGVNTAINLQRSLNDPLFGGYLRSLQQDFSYFVRYGSARSDSYQVTVFEFPSLVRADATIDSPTYANQPTRVVNDTRTVTVVEGAALRWTCRFNKPLVIAELIDRDGEVTSLSPSSSDPMQYEAIFVMTKSKRWKLRCLDDRQRTLKFDEELSAKVILNKPPEVKLARAQDLSVSPLQELEIQATARDDFGIQAMGFTFALSDLAPVEIVFEQKEDASGLVAKKSDMLHLIDLELLKAKSDQLLSYYFWAEDIDRDGKVRRVDGDMFFAEVRPFEEIFREGDSSASEPGQEPQTSQTAKKAEELAELQKQIITGTWNVLRKTDTNTLSEELDVLVESQQDALNQSDALEEEIRDQKSLGYLNEVRELMTLAGQQLADSRRDSDKNLLRDAVQSERKAYEGLLKLRAREHEIVRSEQQKSSSKSQSSSQKNRQEQIEQLKLADEENRYEMEQTPEEVAPANDRETRQVLNRLEELARRQKDLNEQLKEVETAIQEAKNQKDIDKTNELEEQLKRLRENQEELLRDSDELLDRMNQPESQQAMENARDKMEQARNDLQQSVEALEQGKTEPAISSGTRAERQMDETREELRKSSADQLVKTMRDLLQKAEQLESEQEKLQAELSKPALEPGSLQPSNGNELNDSLATTATPLRPEGTGEHTVDPSDTSANGWREQQKRLDELLDQMQETVTEAESSEPLLAEELYESFREAKQKGVSQGMQQIPALLERGMDEPAKEVGGKVAEAVRELRDSIEEASGKVVGSEQASLRLALSELDSAKRSIEAEAKGKDSQSPETQTPDDQSQDSQSSASESQTASGKPGGKLTDRPENGQPGGSGVGLGQMARDLVESAPLTGDDYAQWTDTLRDIEELVSDPDMKADAARIREAAREMRIDYTRHSKDPQWPLVRRLIVQPIDQLREKVQEALLRASAERNAIVPVDRDPLPSNYQRQLEQYYENLGSGLK